MPAIASALGVSVKKLQRLRLEDPAFSDAWDRAIADGAADFDTKVYAAIDRAIKKGHTRVLVELLQIMQAKWADKAEDKPLLLEIPLPDGATLYCPPSVDPIEAIKQRDNVQEIQSTGS
jgi:hypothetical protein